LGFSEQKFFSEQKLQEKQSSTKVFSAQKLQEKQSKQKTFVPLCFFCNFCAEKTFVLEKKFTFVKTLSHLKKF